MEMSEENFQDGGSHNVNLMKLTNDLKLQCVVLLLVRVSKI